MHHHVRRSRRRALTVLPAATAALALAASLGSTSLAPTAHAAPADQAPRSAHAAVADQRLAKAACGTWVLYQVSSKRELVRLTPQIKDALALPGVAGLSVRFPWDAVDLTGAQKSHPILRKARRLANSQDKDLSIRFMAGAHTPQRVFDKGASYYVSPGGARVPLPWDNATGDRRVFLDEYDAYAGKLASWAKKHRVRMLHLSWYGQDWAELNHGLEVREAPGYTQKKWLRGHKQLVARGADLASKKLAVELPLSGYGPLSTGPSAALARKVVKEVGKNSARFFIQANGWDEEQEWGSPSSAVEDDFDKIWDKPIPRGLQMIQPDGYNWSQVFARLDKVGATYAEVYLPSFWQVPGPTPAYDHNTEARIAQLETEIKQFANRAC